MDTLNYLRDFLRYGFVVRRYGGRAGTVKYSELWRYARFRYELGNNGWGVYLKSSERWHTIFGLPLWKLSYDSRYEVLHRMNKFDRFESW
jgi:hypothetical protein